MTIKKTAIPNFIDKKFASVFRFLAKKSRPKFFIHIHRKPVAATVFSVLNHTSQLALMNKIVYKIQSLILVNKCNTMNLLTYIMSV